MRGTESFNPIFRGSVYTATQAGAVPGLGWRTRQDLAEGFRGRGEAETLEQLALSSAEARRLNLTAFTSAMDQQHICTECTQEGLSGRESFLLRRIGGGALPGNPLEPEVSGQRDHHEKDQGFHAMRRLKKHRTHGQRALELPIGVFAVVLLLELREQRVGAGL